MAYIPPNPNGQATMANSAPVVIASNQSTLPVSAASLPLPSGAAQDATLTGGTVRTKLTDGTNNAAVKAASTAAVATDPAVVVAVSPNNTIPVSLATNTPVIATGTNNIGNVKITDGTNLAAVKAASTAAIATDPSVVVNISPNSPAHPVTVSSGTVTTVSAVTAITNALPTGANTIGAVTGPAAAALALDATLTGGTQRTKLTDGTNNAAVKAASTAAVATDPAVVVAISPNNTIPVSLATNTPVIAAGTALIGKVGIDQTTVGTTNAVSLGYLGAVAVSTGTGASGTGVQRTVLTNDYLSTTLTRYSPTTSGGVTPLYTGSIGATATTVKTTAGQVYYMTVFNNNTTPVYVQFFNAVIGSVTLGSTAPYYAHGIPIGGGMIFPVHIGVAHGTAISVACTTTRAGSTSPTNTVDLNIFGV